MAQRFLGQDVELVPRDFLPDHAQWLAGEADFAAGGGRCPSSTSTSSRWPLPEMPAISFSQVLLPDPISLSSASSISPYSLNAPVWQVWKSFGIICVFTFLLPPSLGERLILYSTVPRRTKKATLK